MDFLDIAFVVTALPAGIFERSGRTLCPGAPRPCAALEAEF
jgi:hypothetical protein